MTSSPPGPPREVKLLSEPPVEIAGTGLFEGYASLFGVPDLGRDVVAPGAFRDSLASRGAAGVRMLLAARSGAAGRALAAPR